MKPSVTQAIGADAGDAGLDLQSEAGLASGDNTAGQDWLRRRGLLQPGWCECRVQPLSTRSTALFRRVKETRESHSDQLTLRNVRTAAVYTTYPLPVRSPLSGFLLLLKPSKSHWHKKTHRWICATVRRGEVIRCVDPPSGVEGLLRIGVPMPFQLALSLLWARRRVQKPYLSNRHSSATSTPQAVANAAPAYTATEKNNASVYE